MAEYSTEDQRRSAAVQYWLATDPHASWRRLITQLDQFEEHDVAEQIHRYAEKLTGMIIMHSSQIGDHVPAAWYHGGLPGIFCEVHLWTQCV